MTDRIVKVVLRGEIGDLRAKMITAGRAVGDTADKMTAAGKEAEKFRHGLDELGGTAGKAGLVAAAGLGAIVVATARFESSMSRVQAATHESAENMELLRKAALKAGADTVFSATEAADAITAMSKAGVETKDILDGGLNGALALAAAGELDVASAADIAATAMTQFGLAGQDIPHIADLLAAGAGKAQGEVTDFAQALKYVGPVAHQMGISIEETVGTIAELASQGILADQAGTSLRGMLSALTSPSQQAADELGKLGIQLYDTNGQFIGFKGVAEQLQKTMGDLGNAERDQALGRIFGNEQITAARILYAGGAADVEKWTRAVNDQGFAAETAAIKMDNLSGDVEAFTGSLETTLIGMGKGSQGPLRELVQGATKAVNAFGALPDPVQQSTTAMLGITAITGGGLWFGAKMIRSISDTRDAIGNLGPASQNAARGLGRVTARAAGFYVLATAVGAVTDALSSHVGNNVDDSDLSRALDSLTNGVDNKNIDALIDSIHGLSEVGAEEVGHFFGGASDAIKTFTLGAVDLPTTFEKNTEVVKKFDEQLAQLVESDDAKGAAVLFGEITDAAAEAGVSVEDTKRLFGQYQLALANAGPPTNKFALINEFLTETLDGVGLSAGAAAKQQKKLSDEAAAAMKAATDQAKAWIGLGKGVDDAKVSLQDWLSSLEDQAKALEDFTENALKASKRGLNEGLIASLEAAGPAGALRMQQLADASDAEIRRANEAWKRGQEAIQAYVDMEVPEKKPDVDDKPIHRKLTAIEQKLQRLDRMDANPSIHVDNRQALGAIGAVIGSIAGLGGLGAAISIASGSFADGGWTGPGGKYQPVGVVHGDEYVFSKEATQGNVAMLDVLHRQLRGYSAGGHVGPPAAASMGGFGMGFTLNELRDAVLAARPVHQWTGTYEDFRRLEAEDNRRMNVTGLG